VSCFGHLSTMGAHGSRAQQAQQTEQNFPDNTAQGNQAFYMLRGGQAGLPNQRVGAQGTGPGLFTNRPDQSMLFLNGPRQTTPATPQLQLTETVRNDVNLKKQSLKLNRVANGNQYTLEFDFDAASDCTLSIWYLAEEIVDPASNNTIKFETTYQVLACICIDSNRKEDFCCELYASRRVVVFRLLRYLRGDL
jgi:hypothetical protein